MRWLWVVLSLWLCVAGSGEARAAEDRFITLVSTTSTDNSGLLDHLLPRFRAASGIQVRSVVVGTGQALRIARNGDADVLLVHDRASEEKFVADGFGTERFDVMYNEFILLGPKSDPAGIRGLTDAAAALAKLAGVEAVFVSRGDDSGTHKAELRLWKAASIDPVEDSGRWYRETGSGMGATLNTAAALDGYALSDRATWLTFRNPGDLTILVEGDARLRNPYGVIAVSATRHPHVKLADAQRFVAWLTGPAGQAAIAAFRLEGQVLFHPNAARPD